MSGKQITVTEHLLLHQKLSPAATGSFTRLLYDLILSAKLITRNVNSAGLLDVLGRTGEINVQGEQVQRMDLYANNALIHRMERSGALCAMASEENADLIPISESFQHGEYILIFDPLDGSSNIDVNINVGTIFSIHRRLSPSSEPVTMTDVLQKGTKQVAAGYFLYGPSTMLVYSTGQGAHGFTLDPTVGEFLLSHPDMRMPESTAIYSANEGNTPYWDARVLACVNSFKTLENPNNCAYSARYVGSLVADFHRTLVYGGIFLYPADTKSPDMPNGKLRLMCEASPLAFVAEQAGGMATDGTQRILDIQPTDLHQRTPLFIGSAQQMKHAMTFLN